MQDDDELGNKNLSVGRVSFNVFDESSVGFIATAGDPSERGDNYIGGADFNYRDSTWNGDKVVDGNLWFQQSWTRNADLDGSDSAYGFKLGYPNDRENWRIGFSEIGEEFDAALGFVPRRGIREWFGNWRYRWRPQDNVIRSIDSGIRAEVVTNLSDEVESQDIDLQLIEPAVYEDGARCRALQEERSRLAARLEPLEAEWARRAEEA